MKALYVCAVLSIMLFSCSKEDCSNTIATKNLQGNWKWVQTDGGNGNNIHDTPASTGNNIELKFTAENNYYIYTNSALTSSGTYNLITQECMHDHTNKTTISFSSPQVGDLMIESLGNGALKVSDEVYDGLLGVYSKMD